MSEQDTRKSDIEDGDLEYVSGGAIRQEQNDKAVSEEEGAKVRRHEDTDKMTGEHLTK